MLGGRDMGESLSLVLQVDWNAGRRYQVSEKVVKGFVSGGGQGIQEGYPWHVRSEILDA
jgi:hypothetical protein